jgi:hypothetical protein
MAVPLRGRRESAALTALSTDSPLIAEVAASTSLARPDATRRQIRILSFCDTSPRP